ncbi:MAG: DUF1573 domain-containing protein [Phycisphaerales bacterium]|nr:DUF1573 domain-containing protein [Phycisphaerales bacterium]
MKIVRASVISAVISLVGLGAWCETARAQATAPPPVAIEPPLVDFGKVSPGSQHAAKFSIRNLGAQPITIKSVVPSCKCTGVNALAGSVIAPGASVELLATLDVPRTPGEKEAKVFLTFENGPAPMMAVLKAVASLPINATPAFVDALKQVSSGTIAVASEDGKPFRIVSAGGTAPQFVSFDPAKESPKASYTIKWTAPTTPCESMPLWWIIETDRADCPLIPLRIRHKCTGSRADPTKSIRYWFVPEPLGVAGRVVQGESVVVPITIEHYNPQGKGAVVRPDWSTIKGVRSVSPEMVASLESTRLGGREVGNKDEVALLVRVAPAAGVKGIVYGFIEIETATGCGVVAISMQVVPAESAK